MFFLSCLFVLYSFVLDKLSLHYIEILVDMDIKGTNGDARGWGDVGDSGVPLITNIWINAAVLYCILHFNICC